MSGLPSTPTAPPSEWTPAQLHTFVLSYLDDPSSIENVNIGPFLRCLADFQQRTAAEQTPGPRRIAPTLVASGTPSSTESLMADEIVPATSTDNSEADELARLAAELDKRYGTREISGRIPADDQAKEDVENDHEDVGEGTVADAVEATSQAKTGKETQRASSPHPSHDSYDEIDYLDPQDLLEMEEDKAAIPTVSESDQLDVGPIIDEELDALGDSYYRRDMPKWKRTLAQMQAEHHERRADQKADLGAAVQDQHTTVMKEVEAILQLSFDNEDEVRILCSSLHGGYQLLLELDYYEKHLLDEEEVDRPTTPVSPTQLYLGPALPADDSGDVELDEETDRAVQPPLDEPSRKRAHHTPEDDDPASPSTLLRERSSSQHVEKRCKTEASAEPDDTEDLDLAVLDTRPPSLAQFDIDGQHDPPISLPRHFRKETLLLLPHQVDGVRKMWQCLRTSGILIADDTGLGKTSQTIAFLSTLRSCQTSIDKRIRPCLVSPYAAEDGMRVVVLCPASLVEQWVAAFEKWNPPRHSEGHLGLVQHVTSLNAAKGTKYWLKEGGVLLLSYDLVISSNAPECLNECWGCCNVLVADEAHRARNPKSKRFALLTQRFPRARKILLTGTPVVNTIGELVELAKIAASEREDWVPDLDKTLKFLLKAVDNSANPVRLTELAKGLMDLLDPMLLCRRRDILADRLPSKTEVVIQIPFEGLQLACQNAVVDYVAQLPDSERSFLGQHQLFRLSNVHPGPLFIFSQKPTSFIDVGEDGTWEEVIYDSADNDEATDDDRCDDRVEKPPKSTLTIPPALASKLGQCFRGHSRELACAQGKSGRCVVICELLRRFKALKERSLVFFHYRLEGTFMAEMFKNQDLSVCIMHGSVAVSRRRELTQAFNKGSYDVMLISYKVGGEGLNLQAASRVIHLSVPFTAAARTQATARAHRIGQMKEVRVYHLVSFGQGSEWATFLRTLEKHRDASLGLYSELLEAVMPVTSKWTDKVLRVKKVKAKEERDQSAQEVQEKCRVWDLEGLGKLSSASSDLIYSIALLGDFSRKAQETLHHVDLI